LARWPALDVRSGSADLILALVDDFGPTAVEERPDALRVFFTDLQARDAAGAALAAAEHRAQPVDVDDEDWARRSQDNLQPVTVGRITVAPPWCHERPAASHEPQAKGPQPLVIVIRPSMGFGTGHHATTRLCLRALDAFDLTNRVILDIGTGSGVLAIAAARLGAARAIGIDHDPDAIAAAIDNLVLNPAAQAVDFRHADLSNAGLQPADVVTANLTGGLLRRSAGVLLDLLRPRATLILSGLLEDDRDDVAQAFGDAGSERARPVRVVWEQHEDGWVALGLCCNEIERGG
jgi:ribosomal protein L11 methyltransferase